MNTSLIRLALPLLGLAGIMPGCGDQPDATHELALTQLLQTPAATGSMAPNLAAGPDGSIVLSWIEPDGEHDALRFATFENGNWGQSRTVAAGNDWFVNWADFPSVVPLSTNQWAAHWLVRREPGGYAYDIRAALSSDGGNSWSEPFTPHTDDTDTEHGFVTIYPDRGGAGMLWLDGRKMVNEYDDNDVGASGMTLRAATFNADLAATGETLLDDLTCDCCQTDVALTSDGPVAVYRDRTVNEIRDIYISRFEDGAWQSGNAVSDDNWEIPGCPVNGPVIQAKGEQVAVAWFSAAGDKPRVQVAWSNDSGRTLSAPVAVADGSLKGHVGAAMLPDGDMVVSWLGSAEGGTTDLHIRRVTSAGPSGPDRVVAEASGLAAFSVPQILFVDGALLLAWTDAANDDSRVKTALVPLKFLQ